MSSDIEKKIVEIEFQNRNFEKSIKQSQKSINELNKSLEFKGSEKSIEKIQKALKETELHSLSANVKKISDRFSELGVIGTTALMRITNAAITAGKQLVKSFTIDPISTGLQEYETQIGAVQTILANTKSKGTTLKDVTAVLEDLNKYADQTIYNFTQMSQNIGTFTASGVDLYPAADSIKGIANLAALTGTNAQDASRAMYQLSQALSSGRVALQDWNSLVSAGGMSGEIFQKELRKTSEALGTGAEAAIKAKGTFRESLQTGWLTSEVLTETLKKFTVSGANEWVAEYTGLTQKAVEETLKAAEAQYGEVNAIEQASKQLAEKSGKNQQEIKDVLELAKTAEDAATKVKTFTQLMGTLKEAVQSGWSETWKAVIGDFEEAKELFTGIKDVIEPVITRSATLRNNMLKVWKSLGGRTKLLEGLANISNSILDIWNSIYQAFYDVFGIVGKELYVMTEKFADFTEELVVNEKTMEDIKRVARGLASVLSIVIQVVSAAAKSVLSVFVYMKPLLSTVLHFFAILGDGITILAYVIKQTQIFTRLGMAVARTLGLIIDLSTVLLKLIAAGSFIVFRSVFRIVNVISILYSVISKQFGGIGGFISYELDILKQKFPELGKFIDSLSPVFAVFANKIKEFANSIKITFSSGENVIENLKLIVEYIKNVFLGLIDFLTDVVTKIGTTISNIFGVFATSKWADVFIPIAILTGMMIGVFKILKLVDNMVSTVANSVSGGVFKIAKSISGFLNAKATEERSKAILNFAKAIAVLAISLGLLTFVDADNLEHAAIVLGIFTGALALFMAGLNWITGGLTKAGKIVETKMSGFGVSMLATALSMVLIIKAISDIQEEMNKTPVEGQATFVDALIELGKAFVVLVLVSALMAIVTSRIAPGSTKSTIAYIIQIIGIVYALKQLSNPDLDLVKSLIGLMFVELLMLGLVGIQAIAAKIPNDENSWKAMLASAASIVVLLIAIKQINKMSPDELKKGLLRTLGVIIAFEFLIRAANLVGGKDSSKTIDAMTKSFLALILAMKILSGMDAATIKKGTNGMWAMMGPIFVLTLITNFASDMDSSMKTIVALSGAIAMMSLCASLLSLIDLGGLIQGTVAVTILTAVAGGLVYLTRFVNKNKNGIKTLTTITVMIGILSLSAGLLAGVDTAGLIVAFSGIAVVMVVMGVVMKMLNKMEFKPKALLGLILVGATLVLVAITFAALGAFDLNPSVDTLIGFSVLLLTMSVVMKILGQLDAQSLMYGLLGLLGILFVLLIVFEVVGMAAFMAGDGGASIIDGARIFGDAIGILIGGIIGGVGAGIADALPLIGASLSEFMTQIQGFIEGSRKMDGINFGALFGLVGLLTVMAFISPYALLVPAIGLALLALGGGLNEFVSATKDLSPERLESIGNVLLGVGNLAYGMVGYSNANLTAFGSQLPALATNIVDFCNALTGDLSVEKAQQGAEIFKAFAIVAASVPRTGGWVGAVLGEIDLGSFVEAMGNAGPAIKKFHDNVIGLKYNDVKEGLQILQETINIASTIPNSGGWIGMVMGENDLDTFTEMMVNAAPDISAFVDGIKGVNAKDAEQGLEVLKKTIDAASYIPNSGDSVASWWLGDNSLKDFASQMAAAGTNIAAFINAMPTTASTGADDAEGEVVDVYTHANKAVEILGKIIDVAASIDGQSGFDKWASGDNSLTAFGVDLEGFAPHFAAFWSSMNEVDMDGTEMDTKTNAMIRFLTRLATFTKLDNTTLPDMSNETGQSTVVSLAEGMVTASNDPTTQGLILEAGNTVLSVFGEALDEDSIDWTARIMILNLYDSLKSHAYKKSDSFNKIGSGILDNIESAFTGESIEETAKTLSDGLVTAVEDYLDIDSSSKKFKQIGIYIVEGLCDGIKNKNSEAKQATSRMASTVENQFREDMGIHSPSTLFEGFGGDMIDGLINGLGSGGSMTDIFSGALGDFDISKLFGDYGGDMSQIFAGMGEGLDFSNFSMEGLDSGSFVDQLLAKMQDQIDTESLAVDVEPVFNADAIQSQLTGIDGTLSTTGTGSVAGATMTSFENTKFEDEQQSDSGGKNSFSFVQNNYSPAALDRIVIYRQTRNQFAAMKEVINRV